MKIAKHIPRLATVLLFFPFASFGQPNAPLTAALTAKYYDVKNALVGSNAAAATAAAKELSGYLQSVEAKTATASEASALSAFRAKLSEGADAVAAAKDLAAQRTAFAALSDATIGFVKAAKAAQPAYVAYCPMKKNYWLSNEAAIKNPYYGSAMLTCGKVTETLK